MQNQRIIWQDTAKGIGIMLVVLGHVSRGLMNAGMVDSAGWHNFDFALYTFHMPLFMFLAGLNVPHSLAAGGTRFVRSKILTVAYPYFVWSIIHGSAMAVLSKYSNAAKGWGDVAQILWKPIEPFWFLYVLFFFLMAARYLKFSTLLGISVAIFLFGDLMRAFPDQFLHFPLFFCLGMLVAKRPQTAIISNLHAVLGLLIATVTIALALYSGFKNFDSVLMLPAAIGGGLVVLWIAQRLEFINWLAVLGRISLAVYVMHILAASGLRIVMSKLLHIPAVPVVYLVAGTVAGIIVPVIAYYALRYLNLLPWFGLAVGAKGRAWINGAPRESTAELAT
ncbi:acyltransferase [soil metagenome]